MHLNGILGKLSGSKISIFNRLIIHISNIENKFFNCIFRNEIFILLFGKK